MHKTLKLFTIFLSLIILSGCSSLSGLKFWGDDEEEIELPAVLEEITQKVSISSLWDAKVGKEKIQGRISPSISGERIFYINAEGELFAFEKSNGRKLWEKETDAQKVYTQAEIEQEVSGWVRFHDSYIQTMIK